MSVRVFASQPVLINVDGKSIYEAYAQRYCAGNVNFFPSKADGTPASSWVITVGKNTDWTAAESDPLVTDLFGGDLPNTITDVPSLLAFLRGRTISQVPVGRRNAITASLDALGVPRADFVGTTSLWYVFRRVISTLSEKDDNFASGFSL